MLKPIQFTYEEVRILENRFNMSMYQLKESGDYPEAKRDNKIQSKLLDWLYTAPDDINIATRHAKINHLKGTSND